ncbi:MAG: phytoene dehydrogenase [Flavobacteriaceae bacterium TMED179]|mgnify:FL=1|nr:MAG: phytoene dehydrogenase [Flavobacteriaceae bacterium TMED179]|tara:strand:- start:17555 stop:19021 length:1467 start_codon:yes stop_codon:yes gene_type:complete
MKKSISILGSGFSSLSAACYLAKMGYEVNVFEKNAEFGGRARQFKENGFTFDMGPSWYWMPDVFEKFFNDFGKKSTDFYNLKKLNPAYHVYFGENDFIAIPDELEKICKVFEKEEKGSSVELLKFIKMAKDNYKIAVKDMLYKMPGISPLELITLDTTKRVGYFFTNIKKQVHKRFKNPKLRSILEFPVLFLGAESSNTPAFYNFMNYADFGLGTWQPNNGFYDVVKAMIKIGESLGVRYHNNSNVTQIITKKKSAVGLMINDKIVNSQYILSGADYNHTETLLPKSQRQYSKKYWSSKIFAPSSLLFYLGFDKKLQNLAHHNLFFDTDFDLHSKEIYKDPKWPSKPLFYANFTSMTNSHTAPEGCENGFILVPIAPGLEDTEDLREKYYNIIINRIERITKQKIKKNIIYKKSFCVNDFISEYNSYKGNAYGLANTLLQTSFLRPKLKSSKVKNLFFSGQLSVPGPGVPPSIVSGKLVAELIEKTNP